MSLLLTALLAGSANAASLDLIEVGGNWGTPGATDSTALWWNPAGLAVVDNTSFLVEGAPVLATVNWDRPNPDYGIIDRDRDGVADPGENGAPGETYDYSGKQTLKFFGVVPFAGVKSNFGVKNLGVGAGLAVPYAHSGNATEPDGIGRYQVREGNIQTIYGMLGAAYDINDVVSVGVTGAFYHNTWDVNTDTESVSAIYDAAVEGGFGSVAGYWQDADLENPGYATNLDFKKLTDSGVTFNAGVYLHPKDTWALSLSYNHGAKLQNTGDVAIGFVCPPADDGLGTIGAKAFGLCGDNGEPVTLNGKATIGYNLPGRINAGFVLTAVPKLRLELMGAYVMWHVFDDYNIKTEVDPSEITLREGDAEGQAETAALASQDRKWARDSRDTFWVGLDGKYRFHKLFLGGARVFYDRSAVETRTLATSNFDANMIGLSAIGVLKPSKKFDIGLSAGHHFYLTRTVTDSAFDLAIATEDRKEDRYNYQNSNGVYSGGLTRLGLSVRGHFGGDGDDGDDDGMRRNDGNDGNRDDGDRGRPGTREENEGGPRAENAG